MPYYSPYPHSLPYSSPLVLFLYSFFPLPYSPILTHTLWDGGDRINLACITALLSPGSILVMTRSGPGSSVSHHLVLPRSKASYHIGGLTETLVKDVLVRLRAPYVWSSDISSSSLSPSLDSGGGGKKAFTKAGPDFTVTRPSGPPVQIEVKQRKRGYTMKPEFGRWVAQFSQDPGPSSRGPSSSPSFPQTTLSGNDLPNQSAPAPTRIVVFFTNYGPAKRRLLRRWCAEADVMLVELPAVPCKRSGKDFEFNGRSERRWFARAYEKCLKDLGRALGIQPPVKDKAGPIG